MKSKLLLVALLFFALILFEAKYLGAQKPYGHGMLTEFTKIKLDSSEGLSSTDWCHTGTLTINTPTAAQKAIQTNNLSNKEYGLYIDVNSFFGNGFIRNKYCFLNMALNIGSEWITTSSPVELGVFTSTSAGVFSNSSFNKLYWTTFSQAKDTASVFIDASLATPQIATADTDGVVSNVKFVIKKTIIYSDRGSTLTIKEFASGVVTWSIDVEVTTVFNGSGSDLLDIGITGTGNRYKDDLDVSSTGWTTTMDANIPDRMTAKTQIIAQYFDQNSDATQGSLDVYIEYSIH